MTQIIFFTLEQAILSTLISVPLGFLMAYALTRNKISRNLTPLLSLSLITPSVVAILGFISLFGQSGWMTQLLGFQLFPLYGKVSIIIAHVFFYTPYSALFLFRNLQNIPPPYYATATQLGLSRRQLFRMIEWPFMRTPLATITWMSTALFLTSFTTPLILGGGPRHTTLSVAMYEALFIHFDVPEASLFALSQVLVCGVLALFLLKIPFHKTMPHNHVFTVQNHPSLWWGPLVTSALYTMIVLPLLPIILEAFSNLSALSPLYITATVRAFFIGIISGALTVILSFVISMIAYTKSPMMQKLLLLLGSFQIFIPVSMTGIVLLLIHIDYDFIPTDVFIVLTNIFLALPFTLKIIMPAARQIGELYIPLAQSTGFSKRTFMRSILFPLLKRPLYFSLGISSALGAGDMAAFLMFSDSETPSLSLLLYQQMGAYAQGDAMLTACILLALCTGFFSLFYHASKRHAYT